jgi:uncharacterized protein YfbU (UPF0304 family)
LTRARAVDYVEIEAEEREGGCMQPSQIERAILANQYRILSLLDEAHAEEYDLVREALERGFEDYYMEAIQLTATKDVLSPEESLLVIDAMDMYTALQRSYGYLEDEEKEGIEEHRLDFPGFDGNNESRLYAYCGFVVEREDRFKHLRFEKDRRSEGITGAVLDRYNSHMRMVDIYRKRIASWKPRQDRYQLPSEDIRAILELR